MPLLLRLALRLVPMFAFFFLRIILVLRVFDAMDPPCKRSLAIKKEHPSQWNAGFHFFPDLTIVRHNPI